MPPLSFPSFGEDSCSGGKSSSATSCDTSPSCPSPKLDRAGERAILGLKRSTRLNRDQGLIGKIDQHGVMLVVEPPAEDFETPVWWPG